MSQPATDAPATHFVSASCKGETCTACGKPATHKLSEDIASDDPTPVRHPRTAYVCCEDFRRILGYATRCFPAPPPAPTVPWK